SPEITSFLDPNSWLPEMASQLGPYQTYREALLKGDTALPPDLSVSQIDFTLLKRSSSFAGQVQILAGR
ncbi:MAG: hypothetical protein ACKO4L_19155, partial [Nodosilinea sp.]